jgi:hypothetical protein
METRTYREETRTYRKFAELCDRLAGNPELKKYRSALLEMAQASRELASKEETAD